MKKLIITAVIVALFASGSALNAQDRQENYLGLPGDNLDLYAVMNLFQQSKTLEDFEKSLNDPNTNINNLDLNGDNQVDYIRVIDNVNGDVHNIVLQDAISPRENQDVAVFTVQRFNNGTVQIQLTGDEDLYGKNYIVEPIYDKQTPNPGYTGQDVTYVTTTPAQVAVWPVVRFIYLPTYTVWHSSWYWGYYPNYWHPWSPVSWHYYYGYQSNWDHVYYSRYHMGQSHYNGWHDYYYVGRRAYSPEVNHRIVTGVYKTTYSHPDQRKEGEEKFAQAHPEQYKSIHSNSSVHSYGNGNTGRSTGNNNSSDRRNSGSTLTNRNNNNAHSNGNNSAVTRRTNNTVTTKSAENPTVSKGNTTTSRRSVSTTSTTSNPNRSGIKTNTSSGKSTVTTKSVNNPSGPQNVRTSTQSKTTTVRSPNRSTKQAEKKSTATKDRKIDTDSKGPDRR